jgi:hypothetical protein
MRLARYTRKLLLVTLALFVMLMIAPLQLFPSRAPVVVTPLSENAIRSAGFVTDMDESIHQDIALLHVER